MAIFRRGTATALPCLRGPFCSGATTSPPRRRPSCRAANRPGCLRGPSCSGATVSPPWRRPSCFTANRSGWFAGTLLLRSNSLAATAGTLLLRSNSLPAIAATLLLRSDSLPRNLETPAAATQARPGTRKGRFAPEQQPPRNLESPVSAVPASPRRRQGRFAPEQQPPRNLETLVAPRGWRGRHGHRGACPARTARCAGHSLQGLTSRGMYDSDPADWRDRPGSAPWSRAQIVAPSSRQRAISRRRLCR
jgi:hypothetical protein